MSLFSCCALALLVSLPPLECVAEECSLNCDGGMSREARGFLQMSGTHSSRGGSFNPSSKAAG